MPSSPDPLDGLAVLERGWLSSNNILIHATPGEPGAVLVDSGHVNHAEQTLALVQHALAQRPGQRLAGLVNTHLHSDHCGGNALLQQALGARISVPPGQAQAVQQWDEPALSWHLTGQRMQRFEPQVVLQSGEPVVAGGRAWQVIEAPGHDPDSVMLFDRRAGVLISADALWENGFGVVFPEISGEPGFDDVGAVLDTIAALPVRVVIPGHGRPFTDVAGALDRARTRLAGFKADPSRHGRHALKVLVKYHLMEQRREPMAHTIAWATGTPLVQDLWQRHAPAGLTTPEAWLQQALQELVAAGALALEDDALVDV